jgi:serine protease inhibitor
MRRIRLFSVLLLVTIVISGCTKKEFPTSKDTSKLVRDNTSFAVDLYKRISSTEGNLILSPYSISTAMSMTYAGARGNTEKQIAKALHFSQNQNDLHSSFVSLQSELEETMKRDNIILNIANSLWAKQEYPFKQEYLSLIEKNYSASVTPVDFRNAPSDAVDKINQWVNEKTNGKIQRIITINELRQELSFVLVNTIYFKANWPVPFNPSDTRNKEFWISPNDSVSVPTMYESWRGAMYAEFENLQILELPYVGGNISMYILLPKEKDGLKKLEASLSVENLGKWMRGLKRISKNQRLELYLPKFKMTYKLDLRSPLKAMGMVDAFSLPPADFSGMTDEKIYMELALHKAFIDLNEKGTEAGAATAMGGAGLIERYEEIYFRADHPFLFLIQDNQTGSILFMGRLTNPTKNGEF